MKTAHLFLVPLFLVGAGCGPVADVPSVMETSVEKAESAVVFPVDDYVDRRFYKSFGEYIEDRFTGYHVADDIEFTDVTDEVPVYAIAAGTIERVEDVSGYGGMMMINHGEVNAIYGHIDLSSVVLQPGELVMKGQFLANLGEGGTAETDGERKHLHFGLYDGESNRINGYESTESAVSRWISPQDYFREQGLVTDTQARTFTSEDLGGEIFSIEFVVPANMEVEYIPSLQALNIFTLQGAGSARERSKMLIRYFDASDFLTLSTVTILEVSDLTVGIQDYTARRYVIEKKANVADFVDQPQWRNEKHTVTDFRDVEGRTRYYVVAANPDFDPTIYEAVLASMKIISL